MNFNLNISAGRQAEIRYPSPKGSELIVPAPFRIGETYKFEDFWRIGQLLPYLPFEILPYVSF